MESPASADTRMPIVRMKATENRNMIIKNIVLSIAED